MTFSLGQRWISDSESDQGLGTIVDISGRFVTVLYTATGESRQYAIKDAPLTRVIFSVGDVIPSHENFSITVSEVQSTDELYTYIGERLDNGETIALKEMMLDHFIKFNKPHDRLMNGQFDRLDWYQLRKSSLQYQYQQQQSDLTGLLGGRVSLIPHQLHIAEEVGKRFAPRVLLADEVGLGKTIEAGLIIHQQLVSGRAQRVLIAVPESLMHQWLVEMLRRFNLRFSIFDEERCQQYDGEENPFSSEQLVLVNLDFLSHNAEQFENIANEDWDLLVVDEAHHLQWSASEPSIEYQCIEILAHSIPGVLLLTATPDQLGHESHFARLRLLDSNRFYDYQAFLKEEGGYQQVADAANSVLAEQGLTSAQQTTLKELIAESDIEPLLLDLQQDDERRDNAKQSLLSMLLDRHGTGRILFRNSRNTIKGFPKRQLFSQELALPVQYDAVMNQLIESSDIEELRTRDVSKYLFTPETLYHLDAREDNWTEFDPRVDFLIDLLLQNRQQKVLVICAHAQTAKDLEQALRIKEGIRAAVFHEGMSIFERDKAAAYFAQQEDAAQVLLCSEIGSEGRNFQFAHHLVLFDLPTNPDLLEQRIGRLDRIGQTEDIALHVPYFANSPQGMLLNWYHNALDAFEHTCVTARAVYERFSHDVNTLALQGIWQDEAMTNLIEASKELHLQLKKDLEQGRDKLLEINSSGQGHAQALVSRIGKQDASFDLPTYMFGVFDVFGLNQDDRSDNGIALTPSEHMLSSNFPHLPEDGTTVTFDRDTALSNEDYQLLTWDHPMVTGAMDMVLSDDIGNASIGILTNPAIPVGTFFVECIYTLAAMAPSQLQVGRYLPTTPIRILLDKNGNDLSDKVAESVFDNQLSPVKKQVGLQLVKALKSQIPAIVDKAEQHSNSKIASLIAKAKQQMQQSLTQEHQRLTALASINPNVRQSEIDFIVHQQQELEHVIDHAQLKFEAIRLIVVSS
ncbi:RNA polymerase-associated protein RapA [Thalassotalea sp. HSM 43]|uniref:RNA polymerase-associated protein RapA n=1 Tax=Thalassotalea sp. HSM 43 TaxID=2552945 RepID=UPI00108162AC|nr:RNA polymerase-associated protein RapA [Thalassotalea sp. HSM 43]QBY04877.1 RNA polymerase-associated protein RapA [Thalassotalea sp. HSM 43]